MQTEHKIYLLFGKKMAGHISEKELRQLHGLIANNPQLDYSLELLHRVWYQKPIAPIRIPEEKYQQLLKRIRAQQHQPAFIHRLRRFQHHITQWFNNIVKA